MTELNFSDLLFEVNLGFRSLRAKIKNLQEREAIEDLGELNEATRYLQKYINEIMNQSVSNFSGGWGEKFPDITQIQIFVRDLREKGFSDPDDISGWIDWSPPYNVADIL